MKKAGVKNPMPVFQVLATPQIPTEMSRADFELNEIILKIRKNKKYVDTFKNHPTKEFLFLNPDLGKKVADYLFNWRHFSYHGYGSGRLLDTQDLIDLIRDDVLGKGYVDVYAEWKKNISKIRQQRKEYIAQFKINKTHVRLFDEYIATGIIKMYRRSSQIMNFIILDEIFEYISRKFDCPEYVLRFMTQEEFGSIFKNRKLPRNIRKIKQRVRSSMYVFKRNKLKIITNEKIIKRLLSYLDPDSSRKDIMRGITANLGNITGTARIIFRPTDTFNQGDILVSESTDPDLLPVMKKAKAILTEQGGATSHACILARELNTPCIVGIDGLLDSVKNGDVLEIDGDDGIVKIIDSPPRENLIRGVREIRDNEVDSFGGKSRGLVFLNNTGFGDYLPKTFCGSYLIEKLLAEDETSNLVSEITAILSELQNSKIAVRSSALNEDGKNRSWAGQFDTYLNLEPDPEVILAHIKKLYSGTKRRGKDYLSNKRLKKNGMGFIIQEQISPIYAGVLFTKDPITNDTNKIMIEVVEGLGDKLVSGKSKTTIVKFNKSDLEVESEDAEPDGVLLSFLRKLAIISKSIEKKGRMPHDIEFAIDKNYEIKLLQARPITT